MSSQLSCTRRPGPPRRRRRQVALTTVLLLLALSACTDTTGTATPAASPSAPSQLPVNAAADETIAAVPSSAAASASGLPSASLAPTTSQVPATVTRTVTAPRAPAPTRPAPAPASTAGVASGRSCVTAGLTFVTDKRMTAAQGLTCAQMLERWNAYLAWSERPADGQTGRFAGDWSCTVAVSRYGAGSLGHCALSDTVTAFSVIGAADAAGRCIAGDVQLVGTSDQLTCAQMRQLWSDFLGGIGGGQAGVSAIIGQGFMCSTQTYAGRPDGWRGHCGADDDPVGFTAYDKDITAPGTTSTTTGKCLVSDGELVNIRAGLMTCQEMKAVWTVLQSGEGTPIGAKAVDLGNGFQCAYPGIPYIDETGIFASCGDGKGKGFQAYQPGRYTGQASPTARTVSPSTTAAAPSSGDLGLSTRITRPACDGTGVVFVGAAVTPGQYAADVQRLLDAHPGARYLRTDRACGSLSQTTDAGGPIYAVYLVGGSSTAAVCAVRDQIGGDAYGKWLDNATSPDQTISCG